MVSHESNACFSCCTAPVKHQTLSKANLAKVQAAMEPLTLRICCAPVLPVRRLLAALSFLLSDELSQIPHTLLLVWLRRPLCSDCGRKLAHLLLVVPCDCYIDGLLYLCHPPTHLKLSASTAVLTCMLLCWHMEAAHVAHPSFISCTTSQLSNIAI